MEYLTGWQPIETAPKGNGDVIQDTRDPAYIEPARILVLSDNEIIITYWDWYFAEGGLACTDGMAWVDITTGDPLNIPPTHWMPLPEPPTEDSMSKQTAEEIAEQLFPLEYFCTKCATLLTSPLHQNFNACPYEAEVMPSASRDIVIAALRARDAEAKAELEDAITHRNRLVAELNETLRDRAELVEALRQLLETNNRVCSHFAHTFHVDSKCSVCRSADLASSALAKHDKEKS